MSLLLVLDVPDVRRASRFYVEGLGFSHARWLFGGRVAELVRDGAVLQLLEKPAGTPAVEPAHATAARTYARHWTPLHLDFLVPDVDAAVARAVVAGATLEAPATTHAFGRLAGLADPFGHGFCFVELSAEGYVADSSAPDAPDARPGAATTSA